MPLEIKRADGWSRMIQGYRFAAARPGTKQFAAATTVAKLPPRVDLRQHMTAIENQGDTNSCVANAVAGAYEYLAKRHLGDGAYDVSRMFIYYNARSLEDAADEDEGTAIGDALEGLKTYGACSEETWPFDEELVNDEPEEGAYDEAKNFLVEDMAQVPVDLDAWRQALAEGNPIVFGISLYESFDAQRQKGLVPMPSPKEAARESHDGHAMLCVGYSDPDKLFIVRNSWGDDWGDDGYCYIPYAYLTNPKYNDGDSWIIRRLDHFDIDESTWSHDEESVLPELDTELAAMTEEDHHALLDALGTVPLETRLALLHLRAANADDDISDEELDAIGEYLGVVHDQLGSHLSAAKVLRNAKHMIGDDGLLKKTIALLGKHLSKGMLASIVNSLTEVADADDETSDEESEFIESLVESWQVADELEASEDDEDEDEDEDEDDDDEDEGDAEAEDDDAKK